MTGTIYAEHKAPTKTFMHMCKVLEFDQVSKMVKIRYTPAPPMLNTAIVKWVSYDDISIYTY